MLLIEPLQQELAVSLMKLENPDWSAVPENVVLADADPEGALYADATKIYETLISIPGVKNAIASRVLHLKRPGIFPILDTVVCDLYRDAAARAYEASEVWRAWRRNWRHLLWAAIHADIIDPANRKVLEAFRRALLDKPGNERRMRAASLTDVRLLDILAWS